MKLTQEKVALAAKCLADRGDVRYYLQWFYITPAAQGAVIVTSDAQVILFVKDVEAEGVGQSVAWAIPRVLYTKRVPRARRGYHEAPYILSNPEGRGARLMNGDEVVLEDPTAEVHPGDQYPKVMDIVPSGILVPVHELKLAQTNFGKLMGLSQCMAIWEEANAGTEKYCGKKLVVSFDQPDMFAVTANLVGKMEPPLLRNEVLKLKAQTKAAA